MKKYMLLFGLFTVSFFIANGQDDLSLDGGVTCKDYCNTKRDSDCSFDGKDGAGNPITITCHNMEKK